MFVIPAGMMLGADVSMADWWIWNQIPVLLGNFIGGAVFTGLFLYMSHNQVSKVKIASVGANRTILSKTSEESL
ncbi:Formate/nitrite transporter [compost metagenome]